MQTEEEEEKKKKKKKSREDEGNQRRTNRRGRNRVEEIDRVVHVAGSHWALTGLPLLPSSN